jgi:hypothetical protein
MKHEEGLIFVQMKVLKERIRELEQRQSRVRVSAHPDHSSVSADDRSHVSQVTDPAAQVTTGGEDDAGETEEMAADRSEYLKNILVSFLVQSGKRHDVSCCFWCFCVLCVFFFAIFFFC